MTTGALHSEGDCLISSADLNSEIEELRGGETDVGLQCLSLESVLGRQGFFGEKEILAVRIA
ncbi:hypothetical protein BSZ35_10710 [Salinibacter sp. 10B]|nr:hypothetical protein BSZ35_10710 [Salinibacter sp. 10B]